jgi:pilus assembly protein Flp/PilA
LLPNWQQVMFTGIGQMEMSHMRLLELLKRLGNDEDGATLLEYTVLVAIMLVATIATITLVGGWLTGQWTALNGALPAN